jgi:hypothetical protein
MIRVGSIVRVSGSHQTAYAGRRGVVTDIRAQGASGTVLVRLWGMQCALAFGVAELIVLG